MLRRRKTTIELLADVTFAYTLVANRKARLAAAHRNLELVGGWINEAIVRDRTAELHSANVQLANAANAIGWKPSSALAA